MRVIFSLLILSLVFCSFTYSNEQNHFKVGTAIYDITGPAAEVGMMGYARIDQQTAGIHTRLWSRAYVIEDTNGKRFVFVNTDLGMVMQAVQQKVIARLKKRFGTLYTEKNVMLSATHTHCGPGGCSHYTLYNITVLGFCSQNFNAVVEGIFQSIVKAHNNLAPARIFFNSGQVKNAGKNRSMEAYNANVDASLFLPYDPTMTLLKFQRLNGKEIGMLCWFAVHCTSMGNTTKLINGDNKGFSARKFEVAKKSNYLTSTDTFIAGFANSTLGDVSPNIYGGENGGGINDFASTNISGDKQFQMAWQLYHSASREVKTGNLNFRQMYVDFSKVEVAPEFTDGKVRKTAFAALGLAFAAGAEDGPSNIPFIKEGDYKGHYHEGHGYKPIFLETGKMTPFPWTPEVLPLQMFTLGNLAILAVPGEFTTHSGRRVVQTVAPILQKIGIDSVRICGPSNTYAGYVTTREEYNEQHYEGASTHFGQWTLAAFRQEFKVLAEALVSGKKNPAGPTPRDLSKHQTEIQPGVVFDAPPLFKEFGDIDKDVPKQVERLQVLKVSFWGAHLKNNLKTNDSFLEIQRKNGDKWQTVKYDYDLDTAIRWERVGLAASRITVIWDVPIDTVSGTYRIYHSGFYKNGLSGKIKPYSGYSSEFEIVPNNKITVYNSVVKGEAVEFHLRYPAATKEDLGHKQMYVRSGKVKFTINGKKKVYEALPTKGNAFRAVIGKIAVKTIEVPAGYATDAHGNSNKAYNFRK